MTYRDLTPLSTGIPIPASGWNQMAENMSMVAASPSASAGRSAAWSPGGSGAYVQFTSVPTDTHGFWSVGTPDRLTVPAGCGGIYHIDARLRMDSQDRDKVLLRRITSGGTSTFTGVEFTVLFARLSPDGGPENPIQPDDYGYFNSCSLIYPLSAGDSVGVWVTNGYTVTSVNLALTWLRAEA